MAVPHSTLPSIIGRQGSKIQELQNISDARIRVDKSSQRKSQTEEDDVVDIEISGNSVAIALAKREIQNIVKERTANVSLKLQDIPPELFPFIAGPNSLHVPKYENDRDVEVKIPHYHTWETAAPPQPSNGSVAFSPQEGYYITISGDREGAQAARDDIQQRATQLMNTLTTKTVDVEREKHRFVLGDDAASLHDFLASTNCSVVLPPPSGDTDLIHIIGPPEDVSAAEDRLMELALSMAMTSLDINRQHPGAQRSHALDVARYLQQREALQELERMYESSIIVPDGHGPWQIYSRDGKNGIRARQDIANLVSAQVPARYRSVDGIHPFYQQHLQQQHARQIRDQYGVHLVFADPDDEDSPMLLVYEGPGSMDSYEHPRGKPSNDEVAQFNQSLSEVEQYLSSMLEGQGEVVRSNVAAPKKFSDKVQRYASRKEQQNLGSGFPVQFLGLDDTDTSSPRDSVPLAFRGPSSEVEQFQQELLAFIEEQIRDEAERGYVTSCDFPAKFVSRLVGRQGENINKLRDEFDVEIRVQEGGKVEIQGPKEKAERAKAHIISFARKQEDETTHTVKIKSQYHGELIGPKGQQIRRLQDRYNVRINFPHAGHTSPDGGSVADGDNDNRPRRQQGADDVVIRGPKRGADEARSEILDLYQYMQDHAHSATVSVAQSQVPSLIGQGGRELDRLRVDTGAQIDVPKATETKDPSGRVEVKLRGTKDQVEKAKREISSRAKVFDDRITKTIDIDKQYHRALIGKNGENLRKLVKDAGGAEDERNRLVRFPAVGSQESTIKLEGPQSVVEKLAAAIQSYADEQGSRVTETIDVPPERHGALIGAGGEARRRLESEYKISLHVPDRSATGPARSQVKLTGLPEDVQKAKEAIGGMMKGRESKTVHVPKHVHHHLYNNHGNKLKDRRVRLDHGGTPRPARPEPPASRSMASTTAMPLITDGLDSSQLDIRDHHSWDAFSTADLTDEPDATIPWIMSAEDAEQLNELEELLVAAIAEELAKQTGYLTLPDPSLNQYVVGPRGATINGIRSETGCNIDVPKKGAGLERIEIRGSAEGVEQAKEMILNAVSEGRTR